MSSLLLQDIHDGFGLLLDFFGVGGSCVGVIVGLETSDDLVEDIRLGLLLCKEAYALGFEGFTTLRTT